MYKKCTFTKFKYKYIASVNFEQIKYYKVVYGIITVSITINNLNFGNNIKVLNLTLQKRLETQHINIINLSVM